MLANGAQKGLRRTKDSGESAHFLAKWAGKPSSKERNAELFRRLRSGDETAREEIIRANIGLVIRMANRKNLKGQMYDDLISVGVMAMMRCIDSFDPDHGTQFSTYACRAIKREISEEVTGATTPVRIPYSVAEAVYDIEWRGLHPERVKERGYYKAGALNAWENIEKARAAMSGRVSTHSVTLGNGEEVSGEQADIPEEGDNLDDREELEFHRERLRQEVAGLVPRTRQVIALRFGLDGCEQRSLSDVGKIFGITKERVRQIEVAAIKQIRSNMAV